MQQEISCSYSHAMVYGFNAFDYFLNLQKEEKSRFTKFTTYKIWHCSWRQNSIGAICKSIKLPTNAACSICDNAKAWSHEIFTFMNDMNAKSCFSHILQCVSNYCLMAVSPC